MLLPALADTLDGALVLAYQNNPTLNAQRASARATDEGVPQALSGYRPRVSVNGSIGTQYWDTTSKPSVNLPVYIHQSGNMTPNNLRHHGDADVVQRLSDIEPHAAGGEPGAGGAREPAGDRAGARCSTR